MLIHKIKKGLDLPIAGRPAQEIVPGQNVVNVGILGDDYHGLRVRMHVEEGDAVKRGQPLFEDRKNPGVLWTAPAAGKVSAINRGAKRRLQSVVLQLTKEEQSGNTPGDQFHRFAAYKDGKLPADYSADEARALLIESGLWTAIRQRPFSRVAPADGTPDSIFVNAMDTNPLAANPEVILAEAKDDFERGLNVLAKLIDQHLYVVAHTDSDVVRNVNAPIALHGFEGPHPAGTTGLHIHTIRPVGRKRNAWTINYQDVIAIGRLFATGVLNPERVVALAGPVVKEPKLVRTRLGASIADLTHGLYNQNGRDVRTISGSVLSGKKAVGQVWGYLGRYDLQVSVLEEGNDREFMAWAGPGAKRFSVFPVFLSKLFEMGGKYADMPEARFPMTTSTNGSHRAIIPIGAMEKVMPWDVIAIYLARSLMVGDVEQAERLGALEMEEEDVALLTFVDPGKTEFGPILRQNLAKIEKEG